MSRFYLCNSLKYFIYVIHWSIFMEWVLHLLWSTLFVLFISLAALHLGRLESHFIVDGYSYIGSGLSAICKNGWNCSYTTKMIFYFTILSMYAKALYPSPLTTNAIHWYKFLLLHMYKSSSPGQFKQMHKPLLTEKNQEPYNKPEHWGTLSFLFHHNCNFLIWNWLHFVSQERCLEWIRVHYKWSHKTIWL